MTFTLADPTQLWLELSAAVKRSAWQHSQPINRTGGRWQAYLNQLCLRTFLPWLQAEIEAGAIAQMPIETPPTCWELVNGSVIRLGEIRLALIPLDGVGHDGLDVPQEWVDVPELAADYYLAVQIDVEAGWLTCWGYTTHQELKSPQHYDAMERLYLVSREELVCDLDTLWSTLTVCPGSTAQAAIEPLPTLTAAQADSLIVRLATVNKVFARLSVPFSQWGALLANAQWRQQLYTRRLAAWQGEQVADPSVALRRWFQSLQSAVQTGWQSVEAAFGVEAMQLSESLRGEETFPKVAQVKVVTLGEVTVRLVMDCQLLADERVRVQARLYPAAGEVTLPEGIAMRLVSESGESLQSVEARSQDNFVQLKRFKSPADFSFSVVIAINNEQQICPFET